jgi:hypothetical protein
MNATAGLDYHLHRRGPGSSHSAKPPAGASRQRGAGFQPACFFDRIFNGVPMALRAAEGDEDALDGSM